MLDPFVLGIILNSPINSNDNFSLDNRLGISLELHESGGGYMWGKYIPSNEVRILGQRISEIDNFSFGWATSTPPARLSSVFRTSLSSVNNFFSSLI